MLDAQQTQNIALTSYFNVTYSTRDTKIVLQVKCDSLVRKLESKLKRVARVATEETHSQSSAIRRVAVEETHGEPSAVPQCQASQVKCIGWSHIFIAIPLKSCVI